MAVHAQTNYTLTTKPAKTSLLGGHFIYRVDTTQGALTPSSANIIENVADNPQQWGYNTHIGANGIKLRYNETTLSEWKADHLTFYKPGTNNPSLELISGVNTALNIYNPTNNTKTLGLDISGLNFYGTSTSTPDVTLNADGLTLINGSIRGGVVGQDEFLYLSPQIFADEYEEYILSEDTEVDETKIYYVRSGEEGEYIYTEVSEPTGSPQENEYYEIAHAPGTIPIDNYVKDNWRQIIGRKFAVDTDGNLYANGLNANNANIEGAITATSLTIGSGSDAYDGAAAINVSGYDIEIEKNGIDEVEGVSVYLYPILYHNGVQVPTIEVDYSHFIWYQDDSTIGTEGDEENSGRYLATYGHNYRVIYDFDDGAVGGGTEVIDRTIDPSKYITKISDTGITIHPEVWTNQSSYIQLDGTGMELFNSNGNSIAQYGSTARVGLNNSSRFLMNSNSLEAYDSNNNKYFEVNSNGLSWGNNTAATTDDLIDAAKTATNYISVIDNGGIKIHEYGRQDIDYAQINSEGLQVYKNSINVASFGEEARIGELNNSSKVVLSSSVISMYNADNVTIFSSEIPEITDEGTTSVSYNLYGVEFESTTSHPAHQSSNATGWHPGYTISELDEVANNEDFNVNLHIILSFGGPIYNTNPNSFAEDTSITFTFTKGVSKSYTMQTINMNQIHPNLSGSSTLTITELTYNATTNVISCNGYSVYNDTNNVAYSLIQVTSINFIKHNIKYPLTTIKGDCCLNGNAIGNSSTQGKFFIKETTELFSLIHNLDWDYGQDSAIISVSLYFHNYSVGSDNPAYVSANIEPKNSEPIYTVFWSSSDENVFTVPKQNQYGNYSYNYITATGEIGDSATLTCWINCGGTLVKDTATITIVEHTPTTEDHDGASDIDDE